MEQNGLIPQEQLYNSHTCNSENMEEKEWYDNKDLYVT